MCCPQQVGLDGQYQNWLHILNKVYFGFWKLAQNNNLSFTHRSDISQRTIKLVTYYNCPTLSVSMYMHYSINYLKLHSPKKKSYYKFIRIRVKSNVFLFYRMHNDNNRLWLLQISLIIKTMRTAFPFLSMFIIHLQNTFYPFLFTITTISQNILDFL